MRIALLMLLVGCADSVRTTPLPDPLDGGAPDMAVERPEPEPDEAAYTLRLNTTPPAPLALNLDRDEVVQLLGPLADEIVLLELEARPLLRNILTAVKSACGTDWMNDKPDPLYDCDQTPLGRTFSRDGPWQQSPEFALVRLLTMTPANAVVVGTSIDFLQAAADFAGIGGGFSEILAVSLGIARTDEFIGTEPLLDSLLENLLATHPNVILNGRMKVTLADALADMSTLRERFGPQGVHPGIMARNFVPHGIMFGDDFEMRVTAFSNIRVLDGIKAATGIENINVVVDTTGDSLDDPLEFDFSDPENFQIVGLTENPTVDLRFAIDEHPRFVHTCTGEGCQANRVGNPVGADSVWRLSPWTLEYITAYAAFVQYADLTFDDCFVGCNVAQVQIGQEGNPPGWAHFGVPLELGPKDQYVWELIMEVAQVGLHGPDNILLREGEANVEFTLDDVPAGISGADAAEAVRPYLAMQSSAIAEFLLGDFRERSGAVDFFFGELTDGSNALLFVAPSDLPVGVAYGYARPGFFADAALTQKISSTTLEGSTDSVHEKVRLRAGQQTFFMEDDQGRRYRVRITAQSEFADQLDVFVAEVQ